MAHRDEIQSPAPVGASHGEAPRLLLHAHDSFGLGHLRRTLTLAEAFASAMPRAQVLITTGSPCATHFPLPEGVDVVKLPAATKDAAGVLRARSLRGDLSELVDLRRRLLLATYRAFRPHLVLVDHQPLGLGGELKPLLEVARREGTATALGLRDIIDSPAAVARDWGRPEIRRALATLYDRVLVYGAPEIFDPRVEYPIPPELRERIEFVGYVGRPATSPRTPRRKNGTQRVFVTVGGGQDGARRLEIYLEALQLRAAPWHSTIVLGPLFDADRARAIKRRARGLRNVEVHSFRADLPRLLTTADLVVAMAGYNSVVEVFQAGVPAVFLPRLHPRLEQAIRADRVALAWPAVSMPDPEARTLRAAVERSLAAPAVTPAPPNLEGAAGVVRACRELLGSRPALPLTGARTS